MMSLQRSIPLVIGIGILTSIFPTQVWAASGKISNLSPTTITAGNTITIHGSGFAQTSSESCTYYKPGETTITFDTCTSTLKIWLMKDAQAPCKRPFSELVIESVSPTEIKARVPQSLQSGDGQWHLTLGSIDSRGDSGMWGGEFPLTVTGSTALPYACTGKDGKSADQTQPTSKHKPTLTPTVTIAVPTITPTTVSTTQSDDIPTVESETKSGSKNQSFFVPIKNWFHWLSEQWQKIF